MSERIALKQLLAARLAALDPATCGIGFDSGHESDRHPQAMAYGLFVRAFLGMHSLDGEQRWLNAANEAFDAMLGTATAGSRLAWGLEAPFRTNPGGHPYTITTAMCGHAALDLYETTRQPSVGRAIDEIAHWLIDVLPWRFSPPGAAPWYAPGDPYITTNVVSTVAGFLLRAADLRGLRQVLPYADAALEFTLGRQRPHGWWTYRPVSGEEARCPRVGDGTKIDNLHSAYTLDGLLVAAAATSGSGQRRKSVRKSIATGLRFYVEELFAPDGGARERVFAIDGVSAANRAAIDRFGGRPVDARLWLVRWPEPSRLWAYGAALAMLSRAYVAGFGFGQSTVRIANRLVETELRAPGGSWRHRPDDGRRFVRDEAHVLDGLAALLRHQVV